MSSPEVERFEITQNDLDNEFNINRRQFRQTKHQATYGIWADEDSDDDRVGFGGKKRGGKDFTAPLSFISGGFKDQPKEEDEDEKEDKPKSDSSDEEKASFGGAKQKPVRRSAFQQGKADKEFGQWEKHTKGIGQKLLAKWGFESGKGLGPSHQGIATPVEAVKRKGKAAVGFYGTERSERSLIDFPVEADSEEEEEKEFKQKLHQWKKGDKKAKPKYNYKTADELLSNDGVSTYKKKRPVQSELSKVKVIDMTKKEQRVLSGYHAIHSRHDRPEDEEELYSALQHERRVFDMPELCHNLNMLVDMSEEEIIDNDRKLKHAKDMTVNLKFEQEKLEKVLDNESQQIEKLQKILNIVEACESRTKAGCENPMTMSECAELFKDLQNEYYEEYKIYNLSMLATALVTPMVKRELKDWQPLVNPSCGMESFQLWKDVLQDASVTFSHSAESMDPYDRLMWEIWMPFVRLSIREWNVRICDPLIDFLEKWIPLLPTWIMENILDQSVFPKLNEEVDNWNPLTDTMPIHAWLHPWLPLMGDRLEPLYGPIRHKLGNALTNWHPSDPSAKLILKPWIPVFGRCHTEVFVLKHILPKLTLCMQEFIINPHQQMLDPWNWVMSWEEIIPAVHMIPMLEKCFFQKWLQVLTTWLTNNPNYDEVTKWYLGWKSMIPEEYLAHPNIKEMFNKGLMIMNRAVGSMNQPGARENIAYLTHQERRLGFEYAEKSRAAPEQPAMQTTPVVEVIPETFRELIEQKAHEHDLAFYPIPNKYYKAKPVYQFGSVTISIDKRVVFMNDGGGQWLPVSLGNLLIRAR
ncbi:tuftelin-interacting protein 11-like isoform X2 [Tubulanus polymorphus]|uniref:tuftelin-interacting protein 11-like isoform X2 n=1 Tax=Tubulanus polymorphus TaxID=672921 RepID=UPI003DA331B6